MIAIIVLGLLLAIVVLLGPPLLLLRRRALWRCLAFELAIGALAAVLWWLHPHCDPAIALATFAVAMLAIFSLLLATSPADELRWSASRAALVALLVYACVAPAMLQYVIDGDEPYYLLVTESLVRDHDLDLRNQYRDLAHSEVGRTDLVPQLGDPVGKHGEQYSRHELLLPIAMIPGYLLAGLPGAIATIILFGALLVRSTIRLLEEEGISEATARCMFPFFAFAPPVVFYATRIWPEVPAALLFVEAVRGVNARRAQRWMPALVALVLLKLRFILVGVVMIGRVLWERRSRAAVALAVGIIVVPMLIVLAVSGSATNVHTWRELLPVSPHAYLLGLFGLCLDGMGGLLFQAPFYLLALFALTRWPSMPSSFRLGIASASLYILYLIPRSEWHGGWSPPLRYITFLMPILALGCAALIERSALARASLAPIALASAALLVHGLVYPWRLFHIENGESALGEWLSKAYHADFSRLIPSFLRLNHAAVIGGIVLVIALIVSAIVGRLRVGDAGDSRLALLVAPLLALTIACGLRAARRPGARVDFEDAHVLHSGGELYPEEYQVARFAFRGGWILRVGDSLSFQAQHGSSTLDYSAPEPAMIELAGQAYPLAATGGGRYAIVRVNIPKTGRVVLRCLSGTVNLDRMTHDGR